VAAVYTTIFKKSTSFKILYVMKTLSRMNVRIHTFLITVASHSGRESTVGFLADGDPPHNAGIPTRIHPDGVILRLPHNNIRPYEPAEAKNMWV
jgi:hypothetical protein